MKRIGFFMFACLLVASPAFAGFVNLPETGQTKCYDTAGTEVPCVGTGQDGEIQAGVVWPSPRFVANADTTITDNLTGLVWASNANIMPARNLGWDADGTLNDGAVTWQHALDYVVKLNAEQYLGYADWRLPNVNELESLVNAGEANTAAWLNTQGFTNVQFFTNAEDKKTTYYWTSTSYASTTTVACRVRLTDGWVCATTKSTNYYVWPVRGGQHLTQPAQVWKTGQTESYAAGDDGELEEGVAWPDPRFTDNGDGTVTDNLTGLMWTKDANGAGGTTDWYGALDYVWGMNAGTNPNYGYTDWRLPNRKEMYSLTDVSQYAPALPAGYPFTGVESDYYWSSTTYAYGCSNAWKVLMGYGLVHAYPKSDPSFSYVWPVRAGLHDHTDITPEQAHNLIATDTGLFVADVRTPDEYCNDGHIPGAINLPWPDVFQQRYQELPVDAEILTVCASGYRSNQAATFLDHNGYLHVYDMLGGMGAWQWETETEQCCSTWSSVITKYNTYVSGQATWSEVIDCYDQYAW